MADVKTSVVIQAKVDGLASVQGLNGGLQKLGTTADTTGGKFAKFNGLLRGLGSAIAAAGIARILGNAAEVAAGFESETLLLKQGLENVGAATGELERLQGVADELGKATLFNEEDFRQGFGLLTSFGNIGTENYDRVAMAAANVAQVSGTDVSSAFMQLAKALNDPVAGLSALGRSGIQFTTQQKEMIAAMVEAGDVAGAQNMILKELDAQYGNTAVAAAGGAAGVKDSFGEAMYDLNVAVGKVVNKVLPDLLKLLTNALNVFNNLPGPVQTIIIAVGGLAAGFVLLLPAIASVVQILTLVGGASGIFATLAGWLGIVGPALTAIGSAFGTFGSVLAGIFTGPVGWIALLVAAGVAIYTFRDQIGEALKLIGTFFTDAFKFIGDLLKEAAKFYYDFYVKPVIDFAKNAVDGILNAFNRLPDAIKAPFIAAGDAIKSAFRGILQFLVDSLNTWINRVNYAIGLANKLPGVSIPKVPNVTMPAFAEGGVVTNPTVAMVGEKEREYIIPESKMARASANYLAGMRGGAVIPAFANGGVVGGGGGMGAGNTTVQINTGPVLQQDGQRYVTISDLENALKDFGTAVFSNARTPGGRRYQGVRA